MEFITLPSAKTLGLPLSSAVRAGEFLYLSGAVGNKPGTMTLVEGGLCAQARAKRWRTSARSCAPAAIKPQALVAAENCKVEMRLDGPLALEADGLHFICRWSLPNFYFHVVTAYDILRHKGLAIGKRDYMSHVGPFLRPHQAA